MKYYYSFISILLSLIVSNNYYSQVPTCGADVPFFQVDLTGQPEGTWISPEHARKDNCCGTVSPDRCTSFEIVLDPGAAMINFEIASGAIPPGSMFYQIGCGPQVPVGEPICVVGPGPHQLTFCKPGNNQNTYAVTSIAKPTYPQDDSTRIGCSLPVSILGLENITINSIFPGASGAYNSYLSCLDCGNPSFTPGLGAPAFIDYVICGSPIASSCGYVYDCDTVRLYAFTPLVANASPNPAQFCSGGSGVVLTAGATGGSTSYTYEWYNSSNVLISTSPTFNATSQATYTVAVGDEFNSPTCPSEYISVPVTVGNPPSVNAGLDQDICAKYPETFLNGSVTDATGGVWSGGNGTFDPNNTTLLASYTPTLSEIAAGSVTLTLTSTGAGGGCANDFDQVTINFSDTVDISFVTPILLCSGDQGTVTSNVTNGTAPYTYLWSTGATTNFITEEAGVYWVDVTDNLGCVHRENVTISAPSNLTISMSSTDVSVDGGNDGTATAIVAGGTAPYTYLWSTSGTGVTETGLSYGIVSVTVTDANGCSISGSVVVNEPQCSAFSASVISSNVSCFGGSDGSASASAVGGTPPYSYSWNTSPVSTTQNITGLTAEVYTVTVTDAGSCVDIATAIVTEPSQLQNNMTHVDNPAIGGNIGEATANPSGGMSPYTYLWSGGETTQTISSLFAGTYYVDITDANSCVISDSVIINEPPCNDFNIGVTTTNVSCYWGSDGEATLTIVHGTAPFTILWSDGQTGLTATNLVAGAYTVSVTDASNCTTFQSFNITEPSILDIGLTPTNVSCYGGTNGTIDLAVTGGAFPYEYSWTSESNVISTTEDLINLSLGTYSVEVTDANGCIIVGSVGISQPSKLKANFAKTNVLCDGYSDGAINTTTSGGVMPYSYAWTSPIPYSSSLEDISGLSVGLYNLIITDANNCQIAGSVFIDEPDAVIINNITSACPNPGELFTNVTVDGISGGDETSYSISYDNGATYNGLGNYTTSLNIDNSYQVVAIDGNGCSTASPYMLTLNSEVVIDSITFDPCFASGTSTISITVYPNGGAGGPYEVSVNNGASFGAPGITVFSVAVGNSHQIVVRDINRCSSLASTVVIPSEIKPTASISAEVGCLGAHDGAISLNVVGGVSPYSFSWTGPSSFTASTEDISGLYEGNYSVVVTDANGCSGNTNINLSTFVDVTNPTIVCPSDVVETNDAGLCGAIVNYSTPVGVDNCLLGTYTTLTSGLSSGSFFNEGNTIVTYQVTDSVGNSASCSFTVTVNDIEAPSITCPANVNTTADVGSCSASGVVIGTPITADNCSVATVTNNAPATYPSGNTVVIWTVTDASGNTNYCNQTVTVVDTENPTINCPPTVNVLADAGMCSASGVNLGTPTTSDNCAVSSVVNDAPLTFNVGTTLVTWTVTDAAGNTAFCTQSVTVTDDEDPLISCPANVVYSNDLGDCSTAASNVSLGNPTTSDNCGNVTYTNNAPAVFPVGNTTVTWVATDAAGNTSTCLQVVTIEDNEDPVVTVCAAPVSVTADPGICGATSVFLGSPSATDNCGVVSITNDAPALFPVGVTIVTWTISDANGNTTTCQQQVTITDNENPTITCPSLVTVSADSEVCFATGVSLGVPSATDNCGIVTITNDAPGTYPVGTTTVTWTVTDNSGNTTTCTQDVVVLDNELPQITCASNVTFANDLGDCSTDSINVVLESPNVYDNCGIDTVFNNAPSLFNVGQTNVTWTVIDIHGNSAVCTQVVTIIDNEAPVIVECALPVSVSADPNICGATGVVLGTPTVTDNCGIATVTNNAPTLFPVGVTTVTWTITDVHGNSITCIQEVAVSDDETPSINCPSGIIVSADSSFCYATNVNLITPTVNDNCGVATVTNNAPSIFPVGTTVVTWVATDIHGNTDTCYQDVVVEDNEVPLLTACLPDTSSCFPVVYYQIPTATDNCGIASITQVAGYGPGATFPVGTTTEVWEIEDIHGNLAYCSFDVTIHPEPLPVLNETNVSCYQFDDGSITVNMLAGSAPYEYLWSNGDTTQMTDSLAPGEYSVVVTDLFGCQGEVSGNISEPDALNASETHVNVSCNGLSDGSVDLSVEGGTAPYQYVWNNGTISQDLTAIQAGSYTGVINDFNGCEFTIMVVVTEPDSLVASGTPIDAICEGENGGIDLTVLGGTLPYNYLWSNGDTLQDLDSVSLGTYSVTVTDANGCMVSYQDIVNSYSIMTIGRDIYHPRCYGEEGSIELTVTDGTAPYSFDWSNGDTTQLIEGIPAGTYSVTVTDANNCSETVEYEVIEPDTLALDLIGSEYEGGYGVSGYDQEDGTIDLTIYGGTDPYSIIWNPRGNGESLTDLAAGTYYVTVTDSHGCVTTDSITLTQPMDLEIPTGYTPNQDGYNDYFVIRGVEAFPDNELIIYNRWGNIVYNKKGYANEWDGLNNNGNPLPDGTYFVVFQIHSGNMDNINIDNPYSGYVDLRRTR